jgi:hypothetical protein
VWGLLAGAAGLATAPLEPNVLEEGIVVHTAERMAAGEHLYRDVISHTAPLPYEILALLFRALGTEIALARASVVVMQGIGAAAAWAVARRAGAGVLAHAAAATIAAAPVLLVPLFSTYFYTTLAFYLGLVAVYVALRGVDSTRWATAAGALLAAVALCKQSAGVVFVATVLPVVTWRAPAEARWTRLGAMLLGGAAIALLTLSLYATRGDLTAFVWSQVWLAWEMGSAQTFRMPFIDLWPPGELGGFARGSWALYLPSTYHMRYGPYPELGRPIVALTQLLYALPFLALLATALRAATIRLPAATWLHGTFLLTMTLNLFPRADWGHLVVALPPALVQLVLLAPSERDSRTRRAVSATLVAALGLGSFVAGSWLWGIAGEPSFGPRVPLRPISHATRGPSFPRVIGYLRQRVDPGEPIFVARQEPLLYFATGTTNPTPFEGVLQGVRALQEPPILEALSKIRFVVMSDIDQPLYTFYSDELPAVWAELERFFRIPADFPLDDASWITVLERGPDRGTVALDLATARTAARAWTRDAGEREALAPDRPVRLAARHLQRPLPVALGERGGGLDFEIDVPEDSALLSAVGYRGLVSVDQQFFHPTGTTAVVSIRPDGDPTFRQLAAVRIDDRPAGGRRWTPLRVDLAPYAGRRATLRLEFRAGRPLRGDRLAWFGSPRIVRAPPQAAASR